jgi:hypothetical protein
MKTKQSRLFIRKDETSLISLTCSMHHFQVWFLKWKISIRTQYHANTAIALAEAFIDLRLELRK